jgi:hypothetical protein
MGSTRFGFTVFFTGIAARDAVFAGRALFSLFWLKEGALRRTAGAGFGYAGSKSASASVFRRVNCSKVGRSAAGDKTL